MKRCPQCLFIYPESDQHCDFDNTPLVVVDDSEIEAAIRPRRNKVKFLLIAVVVLVALGIPVLYKLTRKSPTDIPVATASELPASLVPSPSPSPGVSTSPSPSASPSPGSKPSPGRTATSHTSSSLNPVSTGGPANGPSRGGKAIILLTAGGKIEADEVWRTRDGIWYRRNGIVTLLKHNRVKAIANR